MTTLLGGMNLTVPDHPWGRIATPVFEMRKLHIDNQVAAEQHGARPRTPPARITFQYPRNSALWL